MSSEDGGSMMALSESFWEIGQYKRSVKRIDDGHKLCSDLMTMLKERGEIEAAYAKQLRSWSKKWNDGIDKGPEYGTLENAWKGVLEEADKRHDLHTRIRDRILEEVHNTVKLWMKDNFHQKALGVGGIKESKEMEEAFRKAQKPWAKLYVKVDKAKKDYHTACKGERSAIQHEKNSSGDSSVSLDQQKKLAEKVEKCREEKEKARVSYEGALRELNAYNAKYMEDMTQVFEKCQEMEMKRLKFFKEMLFGLHKCLDLSQETKLETIYKEYWESVDNADAGRDLKWWAQTHGTDMAMNWPVFEEPTEDFHQISSSRSKGSVAANTIMLKGVNAQKLQDEFAEYSPELRHITKKEKRVTEVSDGVTLIGQKYVNSPSSSSNTTSGPPSISGPMPQRNGSGTDGNMNQVQHNGRGDEKSRPVSSSPFDDEWDDPNTDQGGQAGVPVRALYDYAAQEEDELSFNKGNID